MSKPFIADEHFNVHNPKCARNSMRAIRDFHKREKNKIGIVLNLKNIQKIIRDPTVGREIKITPRLLKKLKPFWEKFKKLEKSFYEAKREIEKEVEKKLQFRSVEIFIVSEGTGFAIPQFKNTGLTTLKIWDSEIEKSAPKEEETFP